MPDPNELELDFGDPDLNATEQRISDSLGDDDAPPAAPTTDDTPPTDDSADDKPPAAASGGSAQDDDAGTPPAATIEDHLTSGPVHADAKGNLVDAQGRVVATAGPQRRLWEKSQKQERYIGQLERDLAAAKATATNAGSLDRTASDMKASQMMRV